MKYCPVCKGPTKVVNTRVYIRMRVCFVCSYRFCTKEIITDKGEYNKAVRSEIRRRESLRKRTV